MRLSKVSIVQCALSVHYALCIVCNACAVCSVHYALSVHYQFLCSAVCSVHYAMHRCSVQYTLCSVETRLQMAAHYTLGLPLLLLQASVRAKM